MRKINITAIDRGTLCMHAAMTAPCGGCSWTTGCRWGKQTPCRQVASTGSPGLNRSSISRWHLPISSSTPLHPSIHLSLCTSPRRQCAGKESLSRDCNSYHVGNHAYGQRGGMNCWLYSEPSSAIACILTLVAWNPGD